MNEIDVVQETIAGVKSINEDWLTRTKKRLDNLTKPIGSLGRLEECAQKICSITENENPILQNKVIFTLAADHGVTEEGVSAYPKEVTAQMVYNFLRGGAGINVLARTANAHVVVVDMGVAENLTIGSTSGTLGTSGHSSELHLRFKDRKIALGTKNFAKGPAMSRQEATQSIAIGIQLVEDESKNGGLDVVGTGDMGIGNTASSSAIAATFTGREVAQVTGQGTGIESHLLHHKIEVIERALKLNQPNPKDPIDVLSKVGGFEIGGLAGVILGAAKNRVPIVLDGFISGAAALIAVALAPQVRSYLIAAHRSAEPGHDAVLKHLELSPLLDLKMRLGEGTGAALGIYLAESSCKILNEMATFGEAKVSEKITVTRVP